MDRLKESIKKGFKYSTRDITISAIFIALDLILTRFLSFNIPSLRVGFGFLPIAMAGMIMGPIKASILSGVSDVIGAVVFPTGQGAYFPGFTINAILSGLIYGFFYYNRKPNWKDAILSMTITNVFINILLGTYWLSILLNKGFWILLPTRVISNLIQIPIKAFIVYYFWKYVFEPNKKRLMQ